MGIVMPVRSFTCIARIEPKGMETTGPSVLQSDNEFRLTARATGSPLCKPAPPATCTTIPQELQSAGTRKLPRYISTSSLEENGISLLFILTIFPLQSRLFTYRSIKVISIPENCLHQLTCVPFQLRSKKTRCDL